MKIYIASDHAGFKLKEQVKKYLDKEKIPYEDLGTNSTNSVDYPDYANKVARKVLKEKAKGILICGTGTGMCIAANRHKKIRAVYAHDTYSAKMGRHDNDSNILCLRARHSLLINTKKIVTVWLKTPFSGIVRHKRRIRKLK